MSCIDQLLTPWKIFEHRIIYNQITIAVSIDFIAAFDSIARDGIWAAMQKPIPLIQAYYQHIGACMLADGELSSHFHIDFGMRQGYIVSLIIFNFVIDWIIKHALQSARGVEVCPDFSIKNLDYVGGIASLEDDIDHAQAILCNVAATADLVGLKIRKDKTEILTNSEDVLKKISLSTTPI